MMWAAAQAGQGTFSLPYVRGKIVVPSSQRWGLNYTKFWEDAQPRIVVGAPWICFMFHVSHTTLNDLERCNDRRRAFSLR